ncbi:hypothetical protein D1007_54724 [Hordeum vulgare]|nr:hypothetical protein D1007_54724 [Hordeum vulgare]
MDSRRWRSSFGVMVASMAEAPAKAGTSICFEDEPVEDGGGDTVADLNLHMPWTCAICEAHMHFPLKMGYIHNAQ